MKRRASRTAERASPTSTIWSLETAKRRHRHSPRLAESLAGLLPADEPVLDLGCGRGFYLRHLADRGFKCLGVEGTPGISEIALFPDIIEADLSKPLDIDWPLSSVICLEVAEHLWPSQESQLIETIDRYCSRWLVISWAVPGQSGTGHRNCRPNSYVHEKFVRRGFEFMSEPTLRLREVADKHTRYFKNTLLVFRRRDEVVWPDRG